ncbi:MAG: hypothetical protein ABS87_00900 [Sphingomonas sp. SCN 67-18]|nr:helix-turn-helix domain-containing protein [Sphingomonas sp. SCN 67-18]ODU22756.1 MAG: hypothetical protein ABS87_00900 [Sphingomonas sp. SCN 67-18]
MAYHYTESGLDNVYLENGFTVHQTPYGEGLSIKDTEGLHKLIGNWIVSMPNSINGAELRFLRIEMEMTQRNLAEIIGVEEQAIGRWERARSRPISGPADRLLRALYTEYVGGDGSIRRMIERLVALDSIDKPQVRLREKHDRWQVANAA